MPTRILLVFMSALLLSACQSKGPRERDEAALARYSAHAGEPVSSFSTRGIPMRDWASLGENHVAVYTSVNEAWLLELDQPCTGLQFTRAIRLTSSGPRVYARTDRVEFERESCRIREIRKVDVRAMKAERRAESARGSSS